MNEGFMSGSLPDLASVSGDSARWEDWVWADTAGKLASWGCGGRWPPRRFFVAPGSGGKAARTRCKTKCFLEGFALQTSHLSKPAVSGQAVNQHADIQRARSTVRSYTLVIDSMVSV